MPETLQSGAPEHVAIAVSVHGENHAPILVLVFDQRYIWHVLGSFAATDWPIRDRCPTS